jgi:predicted GNAT superfamily acetyltransferase
VPEIRAEATLEVRSCCGFDELEACVALQLAIWGYDELDVIPRRMFTVAQRIGGQVMGAFAADDTLAGFAMSIPGIRQGRPYLHSHMLAVRPEYRNAGVGRRLKLAHREAGSDYAQLYTQFLWCILGSDSGRPSDGQAARRVVAGQ